MLLTSNWSQNLKFERGLFEEEFAGNNKGTENEESMRAVHFAVVEVYLITVFHGQR